MKKSRVLLCTSLVFASVQAVQVAPLFKDTSSRETVVSHNPAVQLGAPNRDSSIYHTRWRLGRRFPQWHDQKKPSHWKQGVLKRRNGKKIPAQNT